MNLAAKVCTGSDRERGRRSFSSTEARECSRNLPSGEVCIFCISKKTGLGSCPAISEEETRKIPHQGEEQSKEIPPHAIAAMLVHESKRFLTLQVVPTWPPRLCHFILKTKGSVFVTAQKFLPKCSVAVAVLARQPCSSAVQQHSRNLLSVEKTRTKTLRL